MFVSPLLLLLHTAPGEDTSPGSARAHSGDVHREEGRRRMVDFASAGQPRLRRAEHEPTPAPVQADLHADPRKGSEPLIWIVDELVEWEGLDLLPSFHPFFLPAFAEGEEGQRGRNGNSLVDVFAASRLQTIQYTKS